VQQRQNKRAAFEFESCRREKCDFARIAFFLLYKYQQIFQELFDFFKSDSNLLVKLLDF